uniref:Uncharacterized protein n=1 Tax=Ixodes ricinus TaxID=34613 RepID=A0A6B0U864_IXORI
MGFFSSHSARCFRGGALLPVIFFPVSRLITETFSSPVRRCGSSLLGSNRGLLPLRLDSGNSSNSSWWLDREGIGEKAMAAAAAVRLGWLAINSGWSSSQRFKS